MAETKRPGSNNDYIYEGKVWIVMKTQKVVACFMAILLLAASLTVVSLAAGKEEETPVYTETVPFEVPEEKQEEDNIDPPQKPAYEDLASRFLTVEPVVDETMPANMVTQLKRNFSRVYATLAENFNYGVMYDVVYSAAPQDSAAYQVPGSNSLEKLIVMNADYFKANRTDLGTLTHELTHALQSYVDAKYTLPASAHGGTWITEGIADVGRFFYDVSSFSLPDYTNTQKYTDAYRVTARFFVWLDQNVDSTFLEQLQEGLKCEAYTAQLFVKITGKTVDELWQMYVESDHRITK